LTFLECAVIVLVGIYKMKSKIDTRFFGSTRGQIVRLMRGTSRTVEELASTLGLTDNAVRAHLATLERDELVKLQGVRRGARKPHFTYQLTRAAEDLFPKAYGPLVNMLIAVLKEKLTSRELREVLRETGRKLAPLKIKSISKNAGLSERAHEAVELLEALGGAPRLEKDGEKFVIQSSSCPLAAAVESHPEACTVAEALVARITGAHVREKCNKSEIPPRCSFEITEKKRAGAS
jgi:predicted ArsR family transcriptional regulator